MTNLDKLAQTLVEPIPDRGTSPYETNATVIRLEDGMAWVRIPGGVEETPAVLAIAALPGDEVRVRVAGGKAYVTGNPSAPPTDDTLAQKAQNKAVDAAKAADEAATQAEDANRTATGAARDASVAKETAESSYHIAANTNQYFWHTESGEDTGAHITEIPREAFLLDPEHGGGNLLARSNGITVRNGLTPTAEFGEGTIKLWSGNYDIFTASGGSVITQEVVHLPWVFIEGRSTLTYSIEEEYRERLKQPEDEIIVNVYDNVHSFAFGTPETYSVRIYVQQWGTLEETYDGEYTITITCSVVSSSVVKVDLNLKIPNPYVVLGTADSSNSFGGYSVSEGYQSVASERYSHASGNECTSSGIGAHSFGGHSEASGDYSHAEGWYSNASGNYSHAEGISEASGDYSHAEGRLSKAIGDYSHAEGISEASGSVSHAEGISEASGSYSHAGGYWTIASCAYQTSIGCLNEEDPDYVAEYAKGAYAFIIGNGEFVVDEETGEEVPERSNALTVDWLGGIEVYLDHNGTSSSDATSGTDKDLFNAIRALGWYSDVIV